MICQHCNANEAKVFLTQIVQGEVKKMDLCECCAKDLGVTEQGGGALADFLTKAGFGPAATSRTNPHETTCPACGYTTTQLRKTGRLGCAQCYETFASSLAEVLAESQKGEFHTGKQPAGYTPDPADTPALQRELEQAVREEHYERAARIRDQLRS